MADYSTNDCSYPSLFGEAQVFNVQDSHGEALRMLYIGDGFQSVTYVGPRRFEAPFAYCRALDETIANQTQARRVLLIGGGAFSLPKLTLTNNQNLHMDVVEIDPAVIEIARTHFFLDELEQRCADRLQVFACDGMDFLRSAEAGAYDVIVNDSFAGIVQSAPLLGSEGLSLTRRALSPQGVYLLNGLAENKNDETDHETLSQITYALATHFGFINSFAVHDEEFFGNINHLFLAKNL